jgi:hypothetical protein
MTPGTDCRTTHGSRAVGMFCSSWFVMLVEIVCRFGSMIGVPPSTWTCSVTPCTPRVTRSGITLPAPTGTDRFRYSANPWSEALIWYVPAGRLSRCTCPCASVTVV